MNMTDIREQKELTTNELVEIYREALSIERQRPLSREHYIQEKKRLELNVLASKIIDNELSSLKYPKVLTRNDYIKMEPLPDNDMVEIFRNSFDTERIEPLVEEQLIQEQWTAELSAMMKQLEDEMQECLIKEEMAQQREEFRLGGYELRDSDKAHELMVGGNGDSIALDMNLPKALADVIVALDQIEDVSPDIKYTERNYLPSDTRGLLNLIDFYAVRMQQIGDNEERHWEFESLSAAYNVAQVALRIAVYDILKLERSIANEVIRLMRYDV